MGDNPSLLVCGHGYPRRTPPWVVLAVAPSPFVSGPGRSRRYLCNCLPPTLRARHASRRESSPLCSIGRLCPRVSGSTATSLNDHPFLGWQIKCSTPSEPVIRGAFPVGELRLQHRCAEAELCNQIYYCLLTGDHDQTVIDRCAWVADRLMLDLENRAGHQRYVRIDDDCARPRPSISSINDIGLLTWYRRPRQRTMSNPANSAGPARTDSPRGKRTDQGSTPRASNTSFACSMCIDRPSMPSTKSHPAFTACSDQNPRHCSRGRAPASREASRRVPGQAARRNRPHAAECRFRQVGSQIGVRWPASSNS